MDVFQFPSVYFETPQAIGTWSLVAPAIHASLSSLESYLLMSNSYILLATNIDTKFWHLTIKCEALLENNRNISSEKQDLEALVN